MDEKSLRATLRNLHLGEMRFFPTLSSTNDEALAWAAQGAPDLSVVVADEQTAGRGREGRKWFTPPGAALAFSLLMRPVQQETPFFPRVVGLAALSVLEALHGYGIEAQVKWPNDVLIGGRKVAGILVEAVWNGETVDCVVIGTGMNVFRRSVPPDEMLQFPAASLEEALGESVPPRELILRDILAAFIEGRPRLTTDDLIAQWEENLAYKGERVEVRKREDRLVRGKIIGLASDGSLLLDDDRGKRVTIRFGDVRLRPAG